GYQLWNRIELRGSRAMRRHALYSESLPERPLFGDSHPEIMELAVGDEIISSLGDQELDVLQQIGMVLDEDDRPSRPKLFIAVGNEYDVAIQRNAGALESDHRHQVCDAFALHVESAASPDVTVLHRA